MGGELVTEIRGYKLRVSGIFNTIVKNKWISSHGKKGNIP